MLPSISEYTNAAISKDSNILLEIHFPQKNIAIYQRDIEGLNQELKQLAAQTIEFRASGSKASIIPQLDDYLNNYLGSGSALTADIAEIIELFEKTTQASSFRLLLATVSTNMCRKFHTDINDLRFLCTYIGPGTLWLPNEAVNHKAANKELEFDPQQIQQVQTGNIVILKGALYPDANPILHRSPTIEEHGERRLLLRIDTNEKLNF